MSESKRYVLTDSVQILDGVGPKMAQDLGLMGIHTVADLLQWYPRAYIDASHPYVVATAPFGQTIALRLTVEKVEEGRTKNRGLRLLRAFCSDESGDVTVQWFNQPYLKQKLQPGTSWIMIGALSRFRGETVLQNPIIETRPVILPRYPQSKRITSRFLAGLTRQVLGVTSVPEIVPEAIRTQEGLPDIERALEHVHAPVNGADIAPAQRSLAYREAWEYFMIMEKQRQEREAVAGIPIPIDLELVQKSVAALPFELTPSQKRVIWDTLKELETGKLVTQLINGDVGSGKTVVASIIAAAVARAGFRTVILAPTEILANQHLDTIHAFLSPLGIKVGIWTAARKDDHGGGADVVVGTHALLYGGLDLSRLALVVVDEQHRFGVRQRAILREGKESVPHMISMTATPIPRTLALTLFADLEVAFLSGKPSGRQPVDTVVISSSQDRAAMHQRILQERSRGHQVFVVCPAIVASKGGEDEGEPTLFTESNDAGRKNVEDEAARLRKEHPEYGVIGSVHGKMKAAEKQQVMTDFQERRIDVLVATSVVEVGVDVPNATVLVVEGAECFGLAQLHQLRGRVGRGTDPAYCFLCPTSAGAAESTRLRVLTEVSDGFQLAEADLEERGPGDVRGLNQSGLPDFRMVRLTDLEFLRRVRESVHNYCVEHPEYVGAYMENGYSTFSNRLE